MHCKKLKVTLTSVAPEWYHYQKSQECFQNGFLEFHPRASLFKLVLSFRSPIRLHYWHFYHKYVTKPFPEMVIDWSSRSDKKGLKEKLLNILTLMSSKTCLEAVLELHDVYTTHMKLR